MSTTANDMDLYKKDGQTPLGAKELFVAALLVASATGHAADDLTMLSLEQLMSLSVVGASRYEQKQSQVAAAVSIITRDEIRSFGWRTLNEALASLPGVYETYDRQYAQLGSRGFGVPGDYNTRVLLTINGNRVNDVLYDSGLTGRGFPLDLDLVDRIEYIPGPGGAVYGQNAMLGVINVVTRTGREINGTELSVGLEHPQSTQMGRATYGKLLDNDVDLTLSVTGMHSRGEDRFYDYGSSGTAGAVAAGLDGGRGQKFYGRAQRGPWSFELVDGSNLKYDPTGAFKSTPLVAGQYQGDHLTLLQGQYEGKALDEDLQILARVFAGRESYTSELDYGSTFRYPATGEWRGAEVRGLYTKLANHKLMLGAELVDSTRIEQKVLDLATPSNNVTISSQVLRTGIYAQDEWKMTPSVTGTLGIRLNKDASSNYSSSPRAALIWQADAATTLKTLYGRAYRAPNAYERDYADGQAQVANPALKTEQIETREVVVDHRIGSDLLLRGSAYRWDMKNIVTLGTDSVSGLSQYQSGKPVQATGLELSFDKTWQAGSRLRGSVSFQQVSAQDQSGYVNSPRQLARVNYSSPLPWAGLGLGYEMRYDSQRRTLDGSNLGAYVVSNLYLRTSSLAKGLEVGLGISNLFNQPYSHPGADNNWQNALEQDGRSVRVKATYRF